MNPIRFPREYYEMNEKILHGWNTWNSRSMLSYVHLPECYAVNLCLKSNSRSAYMKEAYVGEKGDYDAIVFPHEHSYDGSYTRQQIKWMDAELEVTSVVCDDEQIVLVTPTKLPKWRMLLVAEVSILWNKPGVLKNTENGIVAEFPTRSFTVFAEGDEVYDPYPTTQTPFLVRDLNREIVISTGKPVTVEEAKTLIAEKAAEFNNTLDRFGASKELYKAMQTCVAWDTVYDPSKDRMLSPVSRRWSRFWSGYVLFCWDNYFAAQLASVGSKEIAYANLIAITSERTESGFVPNFASAIGSSSRDRSQPPVGAKALLEVYRKWQEKWIVDMLYEPLCVWNDWWFEHRQIEPGLFAWGSDPYEPRVGHYSETDGVDDRFGGALESGLDNSPMYDDIPFDKKKHMLKLADAGLTGLVIMDVKALIALSEVMGDAQKKQELEKRLSDCEKGIQKLWCEEDGFFYNMRTDTGEFCKRISPTNFYALYSGSVTDEQCRRVIDEHFYNPEEFWGDYIMPSIARNDPAYPEQNYWRGRIWAPMNYLVYGALKEHQLTKPARDLAERSAKLILQEWLEKGHVHENYSADTGEGCNVNSSDSFYHWGGLLALIALTERGY